MNKRFSTLVAAFAAFVSVASAQIGDKYVYLVNSTTDTLAWTKAAGDSLAFKKAPTGTRAALDSALWLPKFVERLQSGDSVFQFVNKATQKNLSFAIKKNGAGKYGTMIADGVDKFVYHDGAASEIYASYGTDSIVSLSSTQGELYVGKGTLPTTNLLKVTVGNAGTVNLTAADLKGKISTMKFNFNGKDGGLFTATELIPSDAPGVADKVRFQVVGSEKSDKGTKPDQYITVDTVSYSGSVSAAKFQLDTLCTNAAQYQGINNAALQNYFVTLDLGNDSISLKTDTLVTFDNTGKYMINTHGGASPVQPYVVGYKDLNGTQVLTIDSVQVIPPFITLAKGTPVKLPGGTGVYSLQIKANGGNTYATYNDKFLTGAGATSGVANSVAAASEYVPSTQFYVKEHADGTYSIQGREAASVSSATGANGETYGNAIATLLLDEQPLFAVDAENGVYHLGLGNELDTLVFTKLDVDLANKYIGYKYYTKEEMGYGAVKFNLASKAADDIYLALTKDSVIAGAKGMDNAVELRLIEGAQLAQDTVYYGARALGDSLMRVSYAMEKAYNADSRQFTYAGTPAVVKLSNDGAVTGKRFFFTENPAGDSYKVVDVAGAANQMVTLNISDLSVTYAAPTGAVETYFNIEGAEAPVYAKVEPGHYNIVDGAEMLTASAGVAKLLRVGDELKAAAADSDFSLYVDSAYVNRGDDNTEYGYYIYKGAEVKNDTIVGSVLAAKGDFKANSATGDSAIFRSVTVVADTIAYAGDLDKKGKQNTYKVRDAKNTSLVGFKVVDGEGYVIEALNTASPRKSLAVVNGTVIFSNTVAPQVFTTAATEAPTANEGVEVSEVKVIASEGQVTIAGAAGKKVVITNILGQVVAETAVSSDNATIAAPQGVVVVAVEGEEAVKAIVK